MVDKLPRIYSVDPGPCPTGYVPLEACSMLSESNGVLFVVTERAKRTPRFHLPDPMRGNCCYRYSPMFVQ